MFRHYRQFEGMTEEEVAAELREQAAARRERELARVETLDLSATTWPEYPPSSVVNAITYAARRGLHRYQPGSALRAELAARHGVPAERVAVGAGAAQLLRAAAQALLEPGDELVTPWPSYGLLPSLTSRAVPVPGFGTEAIVRAVSERTRLVALCNPNDPTGELLAVAELRALLAALPERAIVLLDEALRDFVSAEEVDAALPLVEDHPRLLVFRTFSKAWGLAGLRVGYAVGGAGSEPLLRGLAPELGIDELAHAGALEALRHADGVRAERAASVRAERERLLAALPALGVEATPSQANVLWLRVPGVEGAELAHRLARQAVLVAPGGPLGDPERVRASVSRRPAGDRLLRALELSR